MTEYVSSRHVASVMLGKYLTHGEIVIALENLYQRRLRIDERRIITSTLGAMKRSPRVKISVTQLIEDGIRVYRWFLESIDELYFRSSSATRRAKIAKAPKPKKAKAIKPIRELKGDCIVSAMDVTETNICRLAHAVDVAWRGGGWVAPEYVEQKKYSRKKKVRTEERQVKTAPQHKRHSKELVRNIKRNAEITPARITNYPLSGVCREPEGIIARGRDSPPFGLSSWWLGGGHGIGEVVT